MAQLRSRTDLIVVHCSATRATQDIGRAEIDVIHRARGFAGIGYHKVIRRDGRVEDGRPLSAVGAHVEGYNSRSVGVCMVGGVDRGGVRGEDNFTAAQFAALRKVLAELRARYPGARVCGHRDLSPDRNHDGRISRDEWMKECPSFDVAVWLAAPAAPSQGAGT